MMVAYCIAAGVACQPNIQCHEGCYLGQRQWGGNHRVLMYLSSDVEVRKGVLDFEGTLNKIYS
jgi:hypothetical protein